MSLASAQGAKGMQSAIGSDLDIVMGLLLVTMVDRVEYARAM